VVSERELAQKYQVSKTPIREALAQTLRDGLLEIPGLIMYCADDLTNLAP